MGGAGSVGVALGSGVGGGEGVAGAGSSFGEAGVAHEAVHLADEEVDEFGRQAAVDEFALLQGVEKAAHKLIFLFFHTAEKAFQF